ncbi:MAG: hypothetical protein FD188_3457 [Ignavibacteria bacterium]|nr:MAG: hypothetical protein FD188_3457 [Ignavibacteria bacterium]
MNHGQIVEIMKMLFKNSPVNFLGVFTSDNTPDAIRVSGFSPCCYIVNTDVSGGRGKHWVAFFHLSSRSIEFFDSFGRTPASLGFHLPYIQRIVHNPVQIQSNDSNVCGQHCIYYLIQRSHGHSLKGIIAHLKSKSRADCHVYEFIRKIQK